MNSLRNWLRTALHWMCVCLLAGNKCNSEAGQPSRGCRAACAVCLQHLPCKGASFPLEHSPTAGSVDSSALKALSCPQSWGWAPCQAALRAQQCPGHPLATAQPEFAISSRQRQEVTAAFPHLSTHSLASVPEHWPTASRGSLLLTQLSPASHQSLGLSLAVPTMLHLQ